MYICMEIPLFLYIIDRVQREQSGGYRVSFRARQSSLMQSESAVLGA